MWISFLDRFFIGSLCLLKLLGETCTELAQKQPVNKHWRSKGEKGEGKGAGRGTNWVPTLNQTPFGQVIPAGPPSNPTRHTLVLVSFFRQLRLRDTATPGFELRRAWETYRALLGLRLYARGRLLPSHGVIFPLVICPELFFTHTFSIHTPLLPRIHSHIHSGSLIPQSAAPASFLFPSIFPHWVTERCLAGELSAGWRGRLGDTSPSTDPARASCTTRFWACALRAGQGCLASLSSLPQEMTLRTNPKSSPTHHCSSEQFPGRIHWVSRKMFPVVFS